MSDCCCDGIFRPRDDTATGSAAQQAVPPQLDRNPTTIQRLQRNWQRLLSHGIASYLELAADGGLQQRGAQLAIKPSIGLSAGDAGLYVKLRENRTSGLWKDSRDTLIVNGPLVVGTNLPADPLTALPSGSARYDADTQRHVLVVGPYAGPDTESGIRVASSGVWRVLSGGSVRNTTAETELLGETVQFPPNVLPVDRTVRIVASGRYATSLTPTLTIRLKLGGRNLCDLGGIVCPTANPSRAWRMEATLRVVSAGVAGVVQGCGWLTLNNDGRVESWDTSGSVDTTVANTLSLTAQWSAAATGNHLLLNLLTIELLQ